MILTLSFDPEGSLLHVDLKPIVGPPRETFEVTTAKLRADGFADEAITIQDFWLPNHDLGIRHISSALEEFIAEPSEFSAEEKRELQAGLDDWYESGMFVFWCGEEFEMNSAGEVLSH